LENKTFSIEEGDDLAEKCRKALEHSFGGEVPTPKRMGKTPKKGVHF
jgi:hypothetical protein